MVFYAIFSLQCLNFFLFRFVLFCFVLRCWDFNCPGKEPLKGINKVSNVNDCSQHIYIQAMTSSIFHAATLIWTLDAKSASLWQVTCPKIEQRKVNIPSDELVRGWNDSPNCL